MNRILNVVSYRKQSVTLVATNIMGVANSSGRESIRAQSGRKSRWVLFGKVVGTATILAFVLSGIDLQRTIEAVRGASAIWLLLAFLGSALLLVVSTYKWEVLLDALGSSISRWVLFKAYIIGFFASSFLPGIVGGDVVRWHVVEPWVGGRVKVAATILVERFTGVIVLVSICIVVVSWNWTQLVTLPIVTLVICMSIALVGIFGVISHRNISLTTMASLRRTKLEVVVPPIYKLHATVRKFEPVRLLWAIAYSFVFYLVGGGIFFLLCRAFGTSVSFVSAFSVQALTSLLTMIPISLGGLGLAQASDVYLLGLYGIDPATAFGISLVRQLISYGYAIMGGVLFIMWPRHSEVPNTKMNDA